MISGEENVNELLNSLKDKHNLANIHLQLHCPEEDAVILKIIQNTKAMPCFKGSVEQTNAFLCKFLRCMGSKITRLYV